MKKAKTTIPVYDLQAINRMQLHQDIVVESFADILKYYKTLLSPHKHTFYQVVLITKGSGTKTIDLEEINI